MRRLYLPLALAALVGAGLALAALLGPTRREAAQAYAPRGPGVVYLALGDSLATGFRLADPARESYVALLAARLAPLGTREHMNLGVAGATSAALVEAQLPRAVAAIERAQAAGRRVSPITVDIGGNDLRAVERAEATERERALRRVAENLGAALDALRAAAPDADIAVMTYYDPSGGDPALADSDAAWVARLNEVIRTEAQGRGVAVADVYSAFAGGRGYEYTNILFGDIHANRQGHAAIAEQFWRALGYADG